MGVDTRLYLSPKVSLETIATFMQKVSGSSTLSKFHSSKSDLLDTYSQSAPGNVWSWDCDKKQVYQSNDSIAPGFYTINFNMFEIVSKHIYFHYDVDSNEYSGYRILSARANDLNIAIFNRIQQAFGGAWCKADSDDVCDFIDPKKCSYLKNLPSQEDDEKFFYTINFIDRQGVITKEEIMEAQKECAYSTEDDDLQKIYAASDAAIEEVEILKNQKHLEKKVVKPASVAKNGSTKRPRKI